MKAQVIGLTTAQSTPTAGFLQIYPESRYEDGQGNATPGRYDFVLDAATQTWRDMANPTADAYVVTAGPGEPAAIRAMFDERLTYSDGRTARHIYWKWLRSTNLDATQFQYTGEQDVVRWERNEPLTMQAARELLLRGGATLEDMDQALADTAQSRDAADAAAASASAAAASANAAATRGGRDAMLAEQGRKLINLLSDKSSTAINGTLSGQAAEGALPVAGRTLSRLAYNAAPTSVAGVARTLLSNDATAYGGTYAGKPLSWGLRVRQSDLAALNGKVDAYLVVTAAAAAGYSSGQLTPQQAVTLGSTVSSTTSGVTVTLTVTSIVDGWVDLVATCPALPATAGAKTIELLWRVFNPTAAGNLDHTRFIAVQATGLSASLTYPATAAEADPIAPLSAAVSANMAALSGKADKMLPLSPATYKNAVPGRYAASSSSTPPAGVFVSELPVSYAWNANSNATRGEPNVLRIGGNIAANTFKTAAITVRPADLAKIGITPNDSTPPTVSVRVGILKNSLVGVTAANLVNAVATSCVQVWVALRYGLSADTPGYSTSKDRAWVNTGAASIYNGAGATTGAAARTEDADRVWLTRQGIPIPATLNGEALTALKVMLVTRGADGSLVQYEVDQLAVVAGSNIDTATQYLNTPDDTATSAAPAASTPAAQLPARVVLSGGTYYVSASNGAVTRFGRQGSNNVIQPTGFAFVPLTTAEADIAAAAASNLLLTNSDDPAPVRTAQGYNGANHGHPCRLVTTSAAHGLTIEDIGSVWKDAGDTEYVILKIDSATTVSVGRNGVQDNADGSWTLLDTVPATSLIHVSGALHTAQLTISSVAPTQLWPSVRQTKLTFSAGGQAASVAGTYAADLLEIDDQYDIVDYAALLTYLKNRAGSSAAVDYVAPSIAAQVTVRNLWRVRGAETTIDTTLTVGPRPVRFAGAGIVHAQSVYSGAAGEKVIQYVPDTLPVGGKDYSRGVDITAAPAGAAVFTPATWRYASAPPNRMKQVRLAADGTPILSLEVGYSNEYGAGRDSVRPSALDGGPAMMVSTARKQYPFAVGNYSASASLYAAGAVTEVRAFRRYGRG